MLHLLECLNQGTVFQFEMDVALAFLLSFLKIQVIDLHSDTCTLSFIVFNTAMIKKENSKRWLEIYLGSYSKE